MKINFEVNKMVWCDDQYEIKAVLEAWPFTHHYETFQSKEQLIESRDTLQIMIDKINEVLKNE